MAAPISIPTSSEIRFPFPRVFADIYCLWSFWSWPFWQVWADTSWFWFLFISLIMSDGASIFSSACWLSVWPLWNKCLFRSSASFFFLTGLFVFPVLNCVNPLYILDINPLLDISFASIFSHLVDCLFILLMVSFAAQTLLSLIRSRLIIFPLISLAWGDRSKKIWLRLTSKSGFLYFLLVVVWFQALHLGFKPPLNLFLYVFLYPHCFSTCCETMLQVHSFTRSCAVFPAPLLKGLSSPPCCSLTFFNLSFTQKNVFKKKEGNILKEGNINYLFDLFLLCKSFIYYSLYNQMT